MKNNDITVEYIFHSGFTLETNEYFFVFDYFKGDIELPDKPVIVFVSHGHPDHLNEEIFKWPIFHKDITYILSDDITATASDSIRLLGPYEQIDYLNLKIKTFGSTDLGVSFLIQTDGINIFFAGDLNWWHWKNDPDEENIQMEKSFKYEIDKIKGENVDIAFFPVDPRLEESYYLGGEYFINKIKPKYFFPMHFGDNYEMIDAFINIMKISGTKIVKISNRNEKIKIQN
ncbi:MAG: MBL fold metallo-hydrolase [Gudongella sp.]|nr:MBL fold metallo-hydrolase [Gudongella sp.]